MTRSTPIAVVGLDALLPGSDSAEAWLATDTPAYGPVPDGRWPVAPRIDPTPGALDRASTGVGAFVRPDRVALPDVDCAGLPLSEMDPLFGWVLRVVGRALDGAAVDRSRTALWLANLGLPTTGAARAIAGPYVRALAAHVPWLDGGSPHDRWHSDLPAQLAAHAYGLADAVALDAACASGLYAVQLACDRLATGQVDAAVAAAVNRSDSSYLFHGFSQLRALSPTGTPRPLDQRADGLIVGEGAAAVLLMRLDEAVKAGHRIHAVLRGGGLGNDGRKGNMLAPAGPGQLRAMRAAWKRAGLDPATLGTVECHATGTPVGDGVELASLHALLEEAGATEPVAVHSAKALVGHTVTAAGLAGLLRAVGAVRDGVRLPATGADQPHAVIADSALLTTLDSRQPWPAGRPRRAAVSAFGFGGTNAHLVVDAFDPDVSVPMPPPASADPRMAVVGLGVHVGAHRGTAALEAIRQGLQGAPAPVTASRGQDLPAGVYVSEVAVDPRRYKIPPVELADLLPQQLLMLDVAADALAQVPGLDPVRTASIVGMGVDHHVAEPILRWAFTGAGEDAESVAPALTASRVQGSLPNFVANRVAAQFDLQGPSWTVSSGPLSGVHALKQAARLLATDAADAVLVGAVDLPGHLGTALAANAARGEQPVVEGAVALVVMTADAAREAGIPVLAEIDPVKTGLTPSESTPTSKSPRKNKDQRPEFRGRFSHSRAEALAGLLALVESLAHDRDHAHISGPLGATAELTFRAVDLSASDAAANWSPVLAVPHSGPPLEGPAWDGPWDADVLPNPLPVAPLGRRVLQGAVALDESPLSWPMVAPTTASHAQRSRTESVRTSHFSQPDPERRSGGPNGAHDRPAPAPRRPADPVAMGLAEGGRTESVRTSHFSQPDPGLLGLGELAAELDRAHAIVADSHGRWLDAERDHQNALARLSAALTAATAGRPVQVRSLATPPVPPAPTTSAAPAPPSPAPQPPTAAPPTRVVPVGTVAPTEIDLLAHAGGPLSAAFGSDYADLDRYEPRVRMPMPPLLLCHRVVALEGQRGELGPARIVTEYDIPPDADWTATGRPPPCVMVESGQADLLLVSWLGIDAENRGERVYRLLDCDLTFHGPLPDPGETLRHDIRIDRFARLGATTLFYFYYDCVSTTDGRPVLSMRNGCAGFFTPAELATPRGVVAPPADVPTRSPLGPAQTLPEQLGPDALRALADRTSTTLTLPTHDHWRLVHRATTLTTRGGPHGLGQVVFEQDLRDDDWFNPCHFVGDPCMPGTLMFDGCQQAVQLWLLAHGFADTFAEGSFEPLPGTTAKLHCRGQVVPGHTLLRYTARIKDAGLTPTPWALADVVLEVNGTDVVLAEDVGVRIRVDGELPAALPTDTDGRTEVDERRVLEYSIGSAAIGFGPAYADYDGDTDKRCARMPGPPYLTMTRVHDIEGPAGEIEAGRTVVIDYDVPPDAWYFRATATTEGDRGTSMPYAVLLETALQPCGWLTAWQQMAIEGGRDLYFRNLGGEGVQHREVWPHTGTLRTTATLTSTSASGGMRIVFFESTVRAQEPDGSWVDVFHCTTSFGYFSKAALAGQKGLLPPSADEERVASWREAARLDPARDLSEHRELPRDDWRMLHRLTHADATGGREGLGFYQAAHTVDPDTWFFHAHFHLDPVMPGSLGLEALLQLARLVLVERLGPQDGQFVPMTLEQTHSWLYRGQVLRPVTEMTVELEVLALTDDPVPTIRCAGIVRADGLPIYRFTDFGLQVRPHLPQNRPPGVRLCDVRSSPVAALLDRFTVDGDTGHGVLHLDPDAHPWLADHCPTVTVPAVPMAFAAEIAAEAALQLRPGQRVVRIPELSAEKWIHTGDGPVDLLVVAVAQGNTVAVTLAVHEDNPRFPKLSGPKAHMRAVVELGADWLPAEPAPDLDAPAVQIDMGDYYEGGHTFHGPTLQGMTALTHLGPSGARATFATRPDADLLGDGLPGFVLDPLLLDTATHPMWSAEPERWLPGLEPGHLAYPVHASDLRFFGPRPTGAISATLVFAGGDRRQIAFDVHLAGPDGPWCAFRWTEAIVPAGPFLGQPAGVRRTFLWDRAPADVHIGRPTEAGWRVDHADLVEPLPGTLARIACTPPELADRAQAPDPIRWDAARLAAKEAVRAWLRERLGRDVHPSGLTLIDLRPNLFVVLDAPALTAEEYQSNLGPTRFDLHVQADESGATARLVPRG